MRAGRLGWYARRLRAMGPAEVGWRVVDQARKVTWARRQVPAGMQPAVPADARPDRGFGAALPRAAREAVPPEAARAVVAAAERVLAGTWTVLGAVRPDSADPDWFADPVTGRRAPDACCAFRIDHRDESVTGNVKQVWELSRHHHLTVLAAAWWLTGDERFAETTARQLRSWWRANPFLTGVHWTSGIEVGVRLISWAWIRRLLHDWPAVTDLFERDPHALAQLAWHQEYLQAFRSRGSSANNHVIAEAAGQLVAACAFDWFDRSPGWRRAAAALLDRELAANTFPDGADREQASDYHRFVLELGVVALAEADAAGHPLPERTRHRLAAMLDAGTAVLDVRGAPPRQGDGDEGRALVVDGPDADPVALAFGAAGAVLGAPAWGPAFAGGVQAAVLGALATAGPAATGPAAARPGTRPAFLADAGCAVLRSRPGDGPEIWCRYDVGPHGFGRMAAHGHADALSVEVRHDGVPVLVDPGTYCYHGEPAWRHYFRSTLAHNTLQLGGVDQAVSGGPFLWSTVPRTAVQDRRSDGPAEQVVAEHDGYRRLSPPAVHRRSVCLDSAARTLTVDDTVQVEGPGAVPAPVLAWHLGPDVEVRLEGTVAHLAWPTDGGRGEAELLLPTALVWTAHRGETDPPLGWYSPRFGVRVPTTCLLGRAAGPGLAWRTVLRLP